MPTYPSDDALKNLLADAVVALFKEDADLIRFKVSERAITHRIALHLEQLRLDPNRSINLSGWNIDCEYNRDVAATKRIATLSAAARMDGRIETEGSQVYPDIIVHRRGQRGSAHNLLVVEVKNGGSVADGEWDHQKLEAYMEDFEYQCGLFIDLKPLGEPFAFDPPRDRILKAIEQPLRRPGR